MRRFRFAAHLKFARFWWNVRQVFGDSAYDQYLLSAQRRHAGSGMSTVALTREEFYLDSLRRRYSRVSRCC
jgi:uncharacterized short protein YbdD (DUF466 family)